MAQPRLCGICKKPAQGRDLVCKAGPGRARQGAGPRPQADHNPKGQDGPGHKYHGLHGQKHCHSAPSPRKSFG